MEEGTKDWEWQVGLETHEWVSGRRPSTHWPWNRWLGVKPRSAITKGPNHWWRSQHPKARPCRPNPIEPPWYVTRMPGGVGGVAPRGVPLSRSTEIMWRRLIRK